MKPPKLSGLKLGSAGEEWIAYLYQLRGYEILKRNYTLYWQKKIGEIDIICKAGRRIVIVEVRTRENEKFMDIAETINTRKQGYLRRMAQLFMQQHPEYEGFDLQIDVAAVVMDPVDNSVKSVKLIENAIEDA